MAFMRPRLKRAFKLIKIYMLYFIIAVAFIVRGSLMKMRAMLMKKSRQKLIYTEIEKPVAAPHQILIKVTGGICRTDLHVVDGELKHPKIPLVPSPQIIGVIEALATI